MRPSFDYTWITRAELYCLELDLLDYYLELYLTGLSLSTLGKLVRPRLIPIDSISPNYEFWINLNYRIWTDLNFILFWVFLGIWLLSSYHFIFLPWCNLEAYLKSLEKIFWTNDWWIKFYVENFPLTLCRFLVA